jgi:hypothetical protein
MCFQLRTTFGPGSLTFVADRGIRWLVTTPAECRQVFTAQVMFIARVTILPASTSGEAGANVVHAQIIAGHAAPLTMSVG